MTGSEYRYAVITYEGHKVFKDPIAALQYASYMESVGSDSVFYLAFEIDGKTELLERMSVYDMRKAIRGDARGGAGSHEQQLPRSQRA